MALWLGRRDFFPRVKVTLSVDRIVDAGPYSGSDLVVDLRAMNMTRRMMKVMSIGVMSAGPWFRRRRGKLFGSLRWLANRVLPTQLDPHDRGDYWIKASTFCEHMMEQGFSGVVLFCGYAVDVEGHTHYGKFVKIDFDWLPGQAARDHEEGRGPLIFG